MTHIDPDPTRGAGGLEKLVLRASDGARAEVYLHGGQVTSWSPAVGGERLFLSARSSFRDGAPIRGGIPVSFPQFATQGPLSNHGFARTSAWRLAGAGVDADGGAQARFRLADSAATRALWPHAFELELAVRVGCSALRVELAVSNTGTTEVSFTAALHTYFRLDSAPETVVRGLRGLVYRDKLSGAERVRDEESELRIDRALDRVYAGAPADLALVERARTTAIRAAGFPDTVVWNPGAAAAKLADLAPGDEARFVCVEAAAAREPVTLAPGARWVGSQSLDAR